jgi:protein O-mannosyl-transferase
VSEPQGTRKDRSAWLWFAVVVVVFAPAVGGEFLNWDDRDWIFGNPLVVVPGGEAWKELWTNPYMGSWYPLYLSTLRVLWALSAAATGWVQGDPQLTAAWTWLGGPPALIHVASILGFGAAAALWYGCLRRLGIGMAGCALAVAWFALHPLRVESVAWATALRDVLSVLLVLLSWRLHLSEGGGLRRWGAPAAFAAAILCKSMVFALAPALLVLDLLWRGRERRASLLDAIPHLVLGVAGAVVSYLSYGSVLQDNVRLGGSLVGSLPIIGAIQWRYLRLQLCPWDLAALPTAPAGGALGWLALVAGVAALAAAAWWVSRGRRRPLAIALLYLLPMGPVCGLLPLAWPVADRYTLLPSLAVSLALGWAASTTKLKRFALPAAGVVAVGWSLLTLLHIPHWNESEVLWARSLDLYPREWAAHMNYAGAVGGKERMDEAAQHLRIAQGLVGDREPDAAKVADMLMFAEMILADVPLQRIEGYRGRYTEADTDAEAMASLAMDLAATGLREPCLIIVRRAEQLGAGDQLEPMALAVLATRTDDWDVVLYHADRGLDSAPEDLHLLTLKVRALMDLGGREAARSSAEVLAAQLPGTDPDLILDRMTPTPGGR